MRLHPATLAAVTTVAAWAPISACAQDAAPPVERDVAYVAGGVAKQELDLYLPAVDGFPTLVVVHGGSLTSGDRTEAPYPALCEAFRSHGVACAAISYRLAQDADWPAQPNDVADAFAWVKSNIASRGGDPARVFLMGHSSGCLLTAIVAADGRYLAARSLARDDVAGAIPVGCRLNDAVSTGSAPPDLYESSWVPADRTDEFLADEPYVSIEQRNDAVPARHVDAGLPPFLILIAEEERFFPPVLRDAAEFVGRALASDAEADLVIPDDRRHMTAIEEMANPDDPAVRTILDFIAAH